MINPIELFFRITNRLFVLFITVLGDYWRDAKRLNLEATEGKRLLIIRQGGLGDVLFLTAIIAHLKEQHPGLSIHLMTQPRFHGVLSEYCPQIDGFHDHRWPSVFNIFKFDYIAFMDGVVESDVAANTTNIYDLFSRSYFSIELPDAQKKPALSAPQNRIDAILTHIPGLAEEKLSVALQLVANSPVRTPEPEVWARIIRALFAQFPQIRIYVIAERMQYPLVEEFIKKNVGVEHLFVNCAGQTESLEDLFALIAAMDMVVAPDSSIAHIAGAFDLPSLCLYGPFPSSLRTRYYRNTVAIDATPTCAPCFTHGHWPCPEARRSGRINSPCFDTIDDTTIANAVRSLGPIAKQRGELKKDYAWYLRINNTSVSETSRHRSTILHTLDSKGIKLPMLNGADIGYGGDPIIPEAICIDLPVPYTKCDQKPLHLKGSANSLYWFADNALDYIYSSHLFEDFAEPENLAVLNEWLRVIKPGGHLILLLPDQPRYIVECERRKEAPNEHHRIPQFGSQYMSNLATSSGKLDIVYLAEFWGKDPNDYNFLIVLKKQC